MLRPAAQTRPKRNRLRVERVALAALALLLIPTLLLLYLHGGTTRTPGKRDQGEALALEGAQAYPAGQLAKGLTFDRLLLEKKEHRLTAFSKGKAVRVYLVALGSNPVGHKEFEGDRRTPEGKYSIENKNAKSHYYKTLGISYPNAADRERATVLGKSPGGNIKIHGLAERYAGLGQAHRITDWTYGSIALTNPEMEELFSRTPVGTPIEILP